MRARSPADPEHAQPVDGDRDTHRREMGHASTRRSRWRCSAAISTSTSSSLDCFRKGTRIHLGIQEPVNVMAGRERDPCQHGGPRPVLALLELDEVLACDATEGVAEAVMGELRFLPRALDAGGDEEARSEADALLEVVGHAHKGSESKLRRATCQVWATSGQAPCTSRYVACPRRVGTRPTF